MVYGFLQVTARISREGKEIKKQGGFEEVNPLVRQARPFESVRTEFSKAVGVFLGREGRKRSDPAAGHQTRKNLYPAFLGPLFPARIGE